MHIRSHAGPGTLLLAAVAAVGHAGATLAAPAAVPAYLAEALADPARPAGQAGRDGARHPAEVLALAGVKPGDRVVDFMSGGGYYTRLLSRVVGPGGRVYAFTPAEQLRNCAAEETAGTRALTQDPHYANVRVLTAPVGRLQTSEALDVVLMSQAFHDLYDWFMGPADVAQVAHSIFTSLKPGGVLLVIDHVAQDGSGVRDTGTLHRIDPRVIVHVLQAAGFELAASSDVLRNPADSHALSVFAPGIRGRTDQAILKFVKPGQPPAAGAPHGA